MSKSISASANVKPIKVLIVDDHYFHTEGILAYLKEFSVTSKCDTASDGIDALKLLEKNFYDIAIVDIEMPRMDGLELAKIMRKEYKGTKIIVMTAHEKRSLVYEFLELNVSAFLLKCYLSKDILNAFETVMAGGTYITDEIQEMYDDYVREKKELESLNLREEQLSKTEKKIVVMMCEQLTSEQISYKLGTSKSTVDTHRKRIFKKLKIVNSIGIAIYALKKGLFNP